MRGDRSMASLSLRLRSHGRPRRLRSACDCARMANHGDCGRPATAVAWQTTGTAVPRRPTSFAKISRPPCTSPRPHSPHAARPARIVPCGHCSPTPASRGGGAAAAPHGGPAQSQAYLTAPPAHRFYDRTSRWLDCLLAAGILVLGSPLWLAIAVAIKLTSPGPVLFTRTVVGRGGQPFMYYKFRTMYHRNDDSTHRAFLVQYVKEDKPFAAERDPVTGEESSVFKVVGDPRVTLIGGLLARLTLVEIPQLLNVLRGEMSLVGPRPPLEFEYQLYDDATRSRQAVLPGITGLAQVRGRGRLSFTEMVALDLDYVQRRSLLLDLQIMISTVAVLWRGA